MVQHEPGHLLENLALTAEASARLNQQQGWLGRLIPGQFPLSDRIAMMTVMTYRLAGPLYRGREYR